MIEITKPMAKFFVDQCIGTSDGHMAAIPNSPVLYGLFMAHGIYNGDDAKIAEFLREVANKLDNQTF